MAWAASGLAKVHYGRLFEERCRALLESRLSMNITYVGGPGDGGVDFQGWWWLPRLPPDTSTERRRIRILAQCKALDKKMGPIHVRELEGAALLEYNTTSPRLMKPDTVPTSLDGPTPTPNPTSNTMPETSSDLVAVLLSISGFSKVAIQRAMASPVPFLLLHLPPPKTKNQETSRLEGMMWNSKLCASNGLLGGHMEIRQLLDGATRTPELYWQGKRLEHWTPEMEAEKHVGRYNPPAPTS